MSKEEKRGRTVESGPVQVRPTTHFIRFSLMLGAVTPGGEEEDFPPTRCDMPDLSEFSSGTTLDMIPNFIMRGKGPKEHKSLGYVVAFIRLVDKALIEYELCRESLKEAAEGQSHRVAAYFRAADHLENCINSARRAILLGRRVRRDQDAPSVDKKALPSAIEAERLDYFRHSIEHVDEKLQKGELKKDDAVMLTLYADRFGIGDRQESFEWFADLIKRLHQIAVVLADAEVPGTF